MEFDLTWALLALPVAFATGWLASRFDLKQWRLETKSAPKSYFKGLNYLLNEQQDQAIDAFIEAVQQDPDTAELHFALGNLFRNRGDYDRAIRVHQHLLQRGDLSQPERERAMHALARDFTKAGILDRAEASLQNLTHTAYREEALLGLLGLYERTSEWEKAIDIARTLEANGSGSFQSRVAHYLCEQARDLARAASAPNPASPDAANAAPTDPIPAMQALYREAQAICPQAARPRLELAALQERSGDAGMALDTLLTLSHDVPSALPLTAARMAQLAQTLGRQNEVVTRLSDAQAQRPCLDVVEALVTLRRSLGDTQCHDAYLTHLRAEPSLVIATAWLNRPPCTGTPAADGEVTASATPSAATSPGAAQPLPPEVRQALARACAPLRRYRCAACGFEAGAHFWQCPGCQSWDSYSPHRVEEL